MNTPSRSRRHDPDRRARILDAAIRVVVQHGVAGTTHRRIAAEADVPLGSLTYHFVGMEALLLAMFEQVADTSSKRVLARLEQAQDQASAIEAAADVITGNLWSTPDTLLLSYELYAYAARHPALIDVMRSWMDRSRVALGRHFDPLTARAVDAMIEGIGIHNSVDAAPLNHAQVTTILRRIVGADHTAG